MSSDRVRCGQIPTGTPEGVGFLRDPRVALAGGDAVRVEIEGTGRLRNEVAAVP